MTTTTQSPNDFAFEQQARTACNQSTFQAGNYEFKLCYRRAKDEGTDDGHLVARVVELLKAHREPFFAGRIVNSESQLQKSLAESIIARATHFWRTTI